MSLDLPSTGVFDAWGEKLNAAIEGVNDQVTALQTTVDALSAIVTGNGDSSGYLTTAMLGAKNGVAKLDSAGNVLKNELLGITPADIGAALISHQHTLADLPQVNLALSSTLAVCKFNTATNSWPTRASITANPLRPVLFWGDAALPADAIPGVDLDFTVKSSGSTVPSPVVPTPPDPAVYDPNGVKSALPTVVVSGTNYSMSAATQVNTGTKNFTFFQFVVRGPNGEAQDTSFNGGLATGSLSITAGTPFVMTGSGVAASPGVWNVGVSYSLDGTNWTDGPKSSFTITASTGTGSGGSTGTGTPGSGNLPVLGRSGLTYNSGVCDFSNGATSNLNAFASWRNRQLDSTMYFTGTDTWNAIGYLPDGLTAFPGYRVIATASQPSGQFNANTASGANNQFWIDFGKNLAAKGWNDGRTIMRVNWEANGDWYDWAWKNGGASTFVNAIKNVVTSIRANAPKVKFEQCVNRGNVNGGVQWDSQIMDPLIGYIDGIGLDWYDYAPAQPNDSAFNQAKGLSPGFDTIAAYCRAKGLWMTIDEWGVCTSANGYSGGGDSPYFINKMFSTFAANSDVLKNEMYFNVNADKLYQQLYPVDTKPNSSNAYKAR